MSAAAAYLRGRLKLEPRVFMVLGSGLGALAEEMEDAQAIPFAEIPGFAPPTVAGHGGRLVSGTLEGVSCLALQGRFHLYEGHSADLVVEPVRAAAELGADTMIITNAAGGINRMLNAGDLMLIDDHINFLWGNPLAGPIVGQEARFLDMSAPYDCELRALARRVAAERAVRLAEGTYLAVTGPSYETPAEIRMYERYGADAVGMSTVPEVIAARASGLSVLGFSLISNLAAGYALHPLSHEEVIEAGRRAGARFALLMRGVVAALH